MNRAEAGGGCEDDQIDAAVDHFLIGVETGEDLLGDDLYAVSLLAEATLDRTNAVLGTVLEGIADGDQLDVAVGREGLRGSTRSATADADEADLDRVVTTREGRVVETELPEGSGTDSGNRRSLEKLTTASVRGRVRVRGLVHGGCS